jgi:hypothetical protein
MNSSPSRSLSLSLPPANPALAITSSQIAGHPSPAALSSVDAQAAAAKSIRLDHVNLEERIMDWGGDEGTDWWRRRGGGLGEEERSEDWGGEDGTDRFGGVVGIFFTGSFDPLPSRDTSSLAGSVRRPGRTWSQ